MRLSTRHVVFGAALAFVGGALGHRAYSSVPTVRPLTYAGVLTDASGPINGPRMMQVLAYAAEDATTAACVSPAGVVELKEGRFSVPMDACLDALAANAGLWIEVRIDDLPVGGRVQTGAVPYALEAAKAAGASGALRTELDGVATALGRRGVTAHYSTTVAQPVPSSTFVVINFDTPAFDTTPPSVTTGAAWAFTAPATGTYLFTVQLTLVSPSNSMNPPAGAYFEVRTPSRRVIPGEAFGSSRWAVMSGSVLVRLQQGEQADVAVRNYMAADAELSTDPRENHVSIALID